MTCFKAFFQEGGRKSPRTKKCLLRLCLGLNFTMSFPLFIFSYMAVAYRKNMFYHFQATFYFTIGTFFKTFFLPLAFAILAYFFFVILKIYFLFFIFSLPCGIYLFILKKNILKIDGNSTIFGMKYNNYSPVVGRNHKIRIRLTDKRHFDIFRMFHLQGFWFINLIKISEKKKYKG